MKNKLLTGIMIVLVIVLTAMLGINLKMYIDNREKNSIRPIIESQQNLNRNVKNAINKLYKITNDDRNRVVYQYVPDENYVMEPDIKNNYYIFKIIEADKKGRITNTRKCNYLLNKNNNSTNVYFAGGQIRKLVDENSWKINSKYKSYYYNMNKEIEKAYNRIYEYIGNDRYKCEYIPDLDANEVDDLGVNKDYYIFSDYNLDEEGNIGLDGKISPAVKKDTFEIYVYYPDGYPNNYLLTCEEYNRKFNESEVKTSTWLDECLKIHYPYGYRICPDEKSHIAFKQQLNSLEMTGKPGNTKDIETYGYDWYKECLKIHENRCYDLDEHEKNRNKNTV